MKKEKKLIPVRLLLIQVFVKIYVWLHKCITTIATQSADKFAGKVVCLMHDSTSDWSGGWVAFDTLLSSALTLWVCALDASKFQRRVCIILSQFTCKSKYALINLLINHEL